MLMALLVQSLLMSVNVFAVNDVLCCSHHLLQGLRVRGVAVATPSSNATCRDTFYSAPVKCGDSRWGEPDFLLQRRRWRCC